MKRPVLISCLSLLLAYAGQKAAAQSQINLKGFMDFNTGYNIEAKNVFFNLGEQDLFITSDLGKNISFLGESVFKYDMMSSTHFSVSLERAIIKYNYKGNHSILFGKFHTPINYWNDTYHHGRVFYPTVFRPEVFNSTIIPIHGSGVRLSGENLGRLKFGYDLLVSNGIGSMDVSDNNTQKSVTAAFHLKPFEGSRFGISYYTDHISTGTSRPSGGVTLKDIDQSIYTVSASYFKDKLEALTEYSAVINDADSIGATLTHCYYGYAGFVIKDKYVPYIRFDFLQTEPNESFFAPKITNIYTLGFRYEISYLSVVKLEYQYKYSNKSTDASSIYFQFAVGF